jgi:peptidoglycan L-alanyl-D-glutamate endopeptidase CwlK
MINSRSTMDLIPAAKAKVERFQGLCVANGIDILITSTYRDIDSQNALYAQGRTAPGKIVTRAKGGESFHNYKCAVDIVPIVNGKLVWDDEDPVWQTLGELGKQAGLEWAGDWKTFKEFPHFQYTGGLTIEELIDGKKIV